jgi:RecA/RadA recombinase
MAKEKDELEILKKELNIVPATKYKRIRQKCDCLSFGVFPVDFAISEIDEDGFSGIRERDCFELLGPNNSLKTALSIQMIKKTLDRYGPYSVFGIWTEPFDPDRMEQAGIDLDQILMYELYEIDEETGQVKIKQDMAEVAFASALELAKNPRTRLTFIDSLSAAMPSLQMFDKKNVRDLDSNPVAASAKVVNNFVNKFKNLAARSVLGYISHYNEPITFDIQQVFMDQTKIHTRGGNGKDFAADVRILCNSTIKLNDEKHSVFGTKQGEMYNCTWKIIKNKYSPSVPYRTPTGEFDPKTGKFNDEETIIKCASFFAEKDKQDVIHSKLDPKVYTGGSWITIGNEKFQGIDKAEAYLKQHPEIVDKLAKQMYPLNGQFFEDVRPSLEELMENGSQI